MAAVLDGHGRAEAARIGQTAAILMAQQRYAEAEARYTEALAAARAAGDLGLQGAFLQHQGALHFQQGHLDRAVALYQQALDLSRQAGDTKSEMQTADLLGSAERHRGQLDAAEAWYARARAGESPERPATARRHRPQSRHPAPDARRAERGSWGA